MVLFVFEGERPEETLFNAMDSLFLHIRQGMRCIFRNNLYSLYENIQRYGDDVGDVDAVDTLSVLKERDDTLKDLDPQKVSEIYLFFDYDPHAARSNNLSLEELNDRVEKMLRLFNNETNHGKLYISYPMSEALRHTKELPDKDYNTYTFSIDHCGTFKDASAHFSHYNGWDFVSYDRCHGDKKRVSKVRENWVMLRRQNVGKACHICSLASEEERTVRKEDVNQQRIFHGQRTKYIVPLQSIAILSAFPLFLFDYLPQET